MTVLCINDQWEYPKDKITPKQYQVYEVLRVKEGRSGGNYYILKGFSSIEGWASGAFCPLDIYTPNERVTKDIEAPKASSGPIREEAPANC